MVPLKSKDGSVLIKDAVGIIARWSEHVTDLFDNSSATDEYHQWVATEGDLNRDDDLSHF